MNHKNILLFTLVLGLPGCPLLGDWRSAYLPGIERVGYSVAMKEVETLTAEGPSYLEIRNPGTIEFRTASGNEVFFTRIRIKPGVELDFSRNPVLRIGGLQLSFRLIREPEVSNITLVVLGEGGEWEATHIYFKTDVSEYPESWMDFTVRIDPESGTWDLFHDNRMWASDLPLPEEELEVSLELRSLRPTNIQFLTTGRDNPLFPDEDRNGVPDRFQETFARAINASELTLKDAYIQTNGRY